MKKLLFSINIILILILLVLIRYFKLLLPEDNQSSINAAAQSSINAAAQSSINAASISERERKRAVDPNDILSNYNSLDRPSLSLLEFSTQVESLTIGGTDYISLLNVNFLASFEENIGTSDPSYNMTITNFQLNVSYTYNGVSGGSYITNIITNQLIDNYDMANFKSVSISFETIRLSSVGITVELYVVIQSIDSNGMTYINSTYPEYDFLYSDMGIDTANKTVLHKVIAQENSYFYDNTYLLYLLNYYGFQFSENASELGFSAGYNQGLQDGEEGFSFSWLSALFDTANQVLNFEIIAGLKLWYVIGIPALFSLVYMLLKLFR